MTRTDACLVCGDAAGNGLHLDAKCLDDLARDIATCSRLHHELGAVLVRPTRPDDEGTTKRATSVGITLDLAAVTAREHIRATCVGWVRVAQEERPADTVAWPLDDVTDMARWLLRNLTWCAGRSWVDEMARVFAETAAEAARAVQPDRARRVPIGHCPERLYDDEGQDAGVCTGELFAIVRPADSLLPCDIRCTTDGEHRWTADQWHALGRRVEALTRREAS